MSSPGDSQSAQVRKERLRVLIVTDDVGGASQMIARLRHEGLDVQLTAFDGHELSATPIHAPRAILCFLSEYIEDADRIVEQLQAHYAPRDIPIIGRVDRGSSQIKAQDLPFDSTLFAPVHPVQVAHRVSAIMRLGLMEREIVRRLETLRDDFNINITLGTDQMERPFRILFIGRPSPAYMAVIHALQGRDVEIVAAFTSFSAFDYLHDNRFDAVVMNALEGPEPALTITQTMHRNPHLFHVPTLFLIDENSFEDERSAFDAGARDLININAPSAEISNRILELANYHRLHDGLKIQFTHLGGSSYCDPETGVFNADFMSRHLPRVSQGCRNNGVPLTVMAVKMLPRSQDQVTKTDLRRAYAKAIKLIANLVRMQDIVARIDTDTVAIAFPEENETAIRSVLDRMTGLIECAAFETAARDVPPLTMDLDTAIIEQQPHEGADFLIGSALRTVGYVGQFGTVSSEAG